MKFNITGTDNNGRLISHEIVTEDMQELVKQMALFLQEVPFKVEGELELVKKPGPKDFKQKDCKFIKSCI